MPASYLLQRLFLSQLRWNVLEGSLGLMYCSTVYVKLLKRSNTLRKSTLLKHYSSSLLSRTYVVSQTYREHYFVEKSWLRLFAYTFVVCLIRHGICLATPHSIKERQHDESTPFIKIFKLSRGGWWLLTQSGFIPLTHWINNVYHP